MRAHKSIFADLTACAKHTDKFDRNIADEIADFCAKKGRDPYDEFITTERGLPQELVDVWSTPSMRKYIKDRMDGGKQAKAAIGKETTPAEVRDLAVSVISKYFLASEEGNFKPYRITDVVNRTLVPMEERNFADPVGRAIRTEMEREYGVVVDHKMVNTLLGYWRLHADRIDAPEVLAQLDEPDKWCLSRAMVKPDPTVDFPHWRQFFDRMPDDPDVFPAYIAAAYYNLTPKSRQVLYISQGGQGGKGEVCQSLTRLFGEQVCGFINAKQLDGQHFEANFVGKRLAFVPDCNNPSIILTGSLKGISGGDKVPVNQKFEPIRDAYIKCIVIVFSNFEPNIISEEHNYSRTLWVPLQDLPKNADGRHDIDVEYGAKLDAEWPGMLAHGLKMFWAKQKDMYEILSSPRLEAKKRARCHEYEQRYESVFNRFFVLDPTGRVDQAKVFDLLTGKPPEGAGMTHQEVGNWKRWLYARHDIEPAHNDSHRFYPGMRLQTASDRKRGPGADIDQTMDIPVSIVRGQGFTMASIGTAKPNGDARPHH